MPKFSYFFMDSVGDEYMKDLCEGHITAPTLKEAKDLIYKRYAYNFIETNSDGYYMYVYKVNPSDPAPTASFMIGEYINPDKNSQEGTGLRMIQSNYKPDNMKPFTYIFIEGNPDDNPRKNAKEYCDGFILSSTIEEAKEIICNRYNYNLDGEFMIDRYIFEGKKNSTDPDTSIHLTIRPFKETDYLNRERQPIKLIDETTQPEESPIKQKHIRRSKRRKKRKGKG